MSLVPLELTYANWCWWVCMFNPQGVAVVQIKTKSVTWKIVWIWEALQLCSIVVSSLIGILKSLMRNYFTDHWFWRQITRPLTLDSTPVKRGAHTGVYRVFEYLQHFGSSLYSPSFQNIAIYSVPRVWNNNIARQRQAHRYTTISLFHGCNNNKRNILFKKIIFGWIEREGESGVLDRSSNR